MSIFFLQAKTLSTETQTDFEEMLKLAQKVLHSKLTRDVVRVYTSLELPARSADLIEAIRKLPV